MTYMRSILSLEVEDREHLIMDIDSLEQTSYIEEYEEIRVELDILKIKANEEIIKIKSGKKIQQSSTELIIDYRLTDAEIDFYIQRYNTIIASYERLIQSEFDLSHLKNKLKGEISRLKDDIIQINLQRKRNRVGGYR